MTDRIESSLVVDYSVLKSRIGRMLAVPSDESRWETRQKESVDNVIRDGLRQYYEPPQVDVFGPHTWSFLYPSTTIKTVTDQRWYDLPEDFSHLNSAAAVCYTETANRYSPLDITSEARLRELENQESDSGRPRMVATRVKQSRGESYQEWEIGFHPTPNDEFEFAYQYYAAPYMVTEDRPYPLGGQSHSQGILLSCLAAAESYEFGQRGDHYAAFIEQLKADIAHDARRGPSTVGYGGVHRRGGLADRHILVRNNTGLVNYTGR